MKKYLSLVVAVALVIVGFLLFKPKSTEVEQNSKVESTPGAVENAASPLNATYEVDGEKFRLVNGKGSIEDVSNPSASMTVEIFGAPVVGVMDGKNVAVSYLIQQGGGTGTFVYAVAAYKANNTYVGTKAFFLGDRIAPQNIRINNGVAEVNFATRKANEPMSAEPSVGVTKYLVIKDGELVEK